MSGNIHLLQNIKGIWKKVLLLALALFTFEMLFTLVGTSPSVQQSLLKDLKDVPPLVLKMMGEEFIDAVIKYGVIALGYFHPFMLVIFILFPFIAASQLVTAEIASGTIGFTLSKPVSRRRVFFNLGFIVFMGTGILALATFLATFLGITLFHSHRLTSTPFASLAWNIFLLILLISGIIVIIAALCETGKALFTYGGVTLLVLYIHSMAAPLWKPLEYFSIINPFDYYDPFAVLMGHSVNFFPSVMIILITLLMYFIGGWFFSRRDISSG